MSQLASVTRLKTLTVARRVRALSGSGDILVPVGRQVGPDHIVARGPTASAFLVLRASEVLKVSPDKIQEYMLVKEGEELKRGQPMLRKPQTFGRPKVLRSPAAGILARVRDGCLVLLRTDMIEDVQALLKGQVVSVIPNKGVVIETVGSLVQAVWDSGKSAVGRLQPPSGSARDSLAVEAVGPEAAGSVLVAGFVDRAEVLESLGERGAHGLVAGSMPAELCFAARKLTFPVFLTEGVGRRPMAEPVFELLKRSSGREVSILGASNVHRPQPAEIIIPFPASGPLPQVNTGDESLRMGSLVRLVGLGDKTVLGRVARLHAQPRRTAYGGMAAGADIALADGTAMFAPYANLELIG